MTDHTAPDLRDLLAVCEEAARAAGLIALAGFKGPMEVRSKGGTDIVTEFDTRAERAATELILERFPGDAVLGEEAGSRAPDGHGSPRLWTIDPIDGTHNYAAQLPFWCTSVAVADASSGSLIAGAVFDAVHDELFSTIRGGGAWLNGREIAASEIASAGDAFVTTDAGYEPEVARRMTALVPWMQPRVKRIRLLGSAVLALCYVAAGRVDAYYHLSLQPWDVAAASLIVTEAGGAISAWDGGPLGDGRRGAIAANRYLHPLLVRLIAEGEQQRNRA
jgi:myo-inositol-1(or 4)-monophosphatase